MDSIKRLMNFVNAFEKLQPKLLNYPFGMYGSLGQIDIAKKMMPQFNILHDWFEKDRLMRSDILPASFFNDSLSRSINAISSVLPNAIRKLNSDISWAENLAQYDMWLQLIKPVQIALPQHDALKSVLGLFLTRMAEVNALSSGICLSLPSETIGRTNAIRQYVEIVQGGMDKIIPSYETLCKKFEEDTTAILSISPKSAMMTSWGFFNDIDLLGQLGRGAVDKRFAHQVVRKRNEIDFGLKEEQDLTDFLYENQLIDLLEGAEMALTNYGPDSSRHVCSSVRQLLRGALEYLASDDEIVPWARSQSDIPQNKILTPTSRARFLARRIEIISDKFWEPNIAMLLEVIEKSSEQIHDNVTRFSKIELRIMLRQAKTLLAHFVDISKIESPK